MRRAAVLVVPFLFALTSSWTSAAEPVRRLIVPVIGSTAGAAGANFRSDLQLHNPSSEPSQGYFVFRPAGTAGVAGGERLEWFLEAYATRSYDDLVRMMGQSGLGSLDIVIERGALPVVTARAYDDGGVFGTKGVAVPALEEKAAIAAGQRITLIAPAAASGARFNVGLRTLGAAVRVSIDLRSPEGDLVAALGERSWPADYFEQLPAASFLGRSIEASQSIVITVIEGSAIFYATMTDNATNDPSLQLPLGTDNELPHAVPQTVRTDRDRAVTIRLEAVDPDDEHLLFFITAQPGVGSISGLRRIDGKSVEVTYTPGAGFEGVDEFTFSVEDANGGSSSAAATIIVGSPQNRPPTAVSQVVTTSLNTPVEITLGATDPDGDPLVFSIETPPKRGSLQPIIPLSGTSATVLYLPAGGFVGNDSFGFRVEDGRGGSSVATVTIDVQPANRPPAAHEQSVTTNRDVAVAITLTGSDADGDPLTFSVTSAPSSGTLSGTAPNLTYTPSPGFTGNDSFTFVVNDGTVNSAAATVSITVNATVNTAPVANADAYSTVLNVTLNVPAPGVLANDIDAEGDPLTAILVSTTSNGLLTLNADGSFTYVPGAGFFGTDSFTYRASDGLLESAAVQVVITVIESNMAPIALTLTGSSVAENQPAGTTVGTFSTDDPNPGDTHIYSLVAGSGSTHNASFQIIGNQLQTAVILDFELQPALSIRVRTTDGGGLFFEESFIITVIDVDDPPVAADDSYSVARGGTLTVGAAAGVLANDSDVDSTTLTAQLETNPADGALTLAADGSFTYVHDGSLAASDSFTYRAHDGNSSSNLATVTIAITAVNTAPVASDDAYNVVNGGTLVVAAATGVLANDSDAEGAVLTAVLVSGVASGMLTFEADGSFSYQHDGGVSITDSFTYRAHDGQDESNLATVVITITAGNTAPLAVADDYSVARGATLTISAPGVLANDSDADGDALTAQLVSGTSSGLLTLQADGSFTYVHDGGASATDSFSYQAHDGQTVSNVVVVSIEIRDVNSAPIANDDAYTTNEDETLVVTAPGVLANDSDPDGDALTAVLVSTTSNGTLSLSANGSFVYVPAPDFFGTDSFTYRASDGAESSNAATVTITVDPVNDPPSFTRGADLTVDSTGGGVRTFTAWATDLSPGPANESGQTLTFLVTHNSDASLFTAGPAISGTSGDLTFTPVADAQGVATITIVLQDAGGVANGGLDTSAPVTFTIQLDAAPRVISVIPPPGSAAAPSSAITINFSETVEATTASFEIHCPASNALSYTLSASPAASFTLTPATMLPPGAECQVKVVATEISDTDTFDPPDQMVADYTFSFTIAEGGALTSTITANPVSIVADGASTSTITVQLRDADGINLTTSGGVVALSTTGGTLSAVTDHNDGSYTATLTSSTTAGTVIVSGTLNGSLLVNTASVDFTAGAPAAYVVTAASATAVAGEPVMITAQLVDSHDNLVEIAGVVVTWASTNGGSFASPTSPTNAAGIATISFTTATAAGTVHTVTATDGDLRTGTSGEITTQAGAAVKYLVSAASPTAVAGEAVTVTAQLADANDNPVATPNVTVTWSSTNGGTFPGPSLTDVAGLATTSFTTATIAGVTHTVTAEDAALRSGMSGSILTLTGPAAKYLVTASDDAPAAGDAVTIFAQLSDANDNPVATAGLSVDWSSSGGGTLVPASSPTDAAGVATTSFTTATIALTSHIVTADDGAHSGSSSPIVTRAGAASLDETIITASPGSIVADGTSTSSVTVQLRDSNGNDLSAGGGTVVLSTTGGELSNGVDDGASVTAVDHGNGTYSAILTSPVTVGSATISGTLGGSALSDTASVTFVHGPPAKLSFSVQPSSTVAGASITPAIEVSVLDLNDNLVSSSTDSVTLAIHDNPGSGTLSGTLTVDATGGLATFAGVSIDKAGSGYTLEASSGSLITAVSSSFDITAAGFDSFRVASVSDGPIENQAVNVAFDIRITAIDPFGNTVLFDGTVEISSTGALTDGAGPTAPFSAGVLAAHSVTFSGQGTYTITALNSAGSESGTSDPFYVDAPPAVTTTTPADLSTGVNPASDITINFGESVTADAASFELACPSTTSLAFTVAPAGPASSYVLTPDAALPAATECRVVVFAAGITDVDGALPYSNMLADFEFTFTTNHPPVAVDDSYTLRAGQSHAMTAALGVLANDTDFEGMALTATLVSDASVGTLVLDGDGSFSYDLTGVTDETIVSDSFTYRVSDGIALSNVATVNITISHNAPPVANDDSYQVLEDQELVITAPGLLANDTDPDDNITRVILISGPSSGSFTTPVVVGDDELLDDGSFRYLPAQDFVGDVTFTYQLEDAGGLLSGIATVTITVLPVNDPPHFTPGPATVTVAEDAGAQFIAWASDIRPGPLTAVDEVGQSLTFHVTHSNPTLLEGGAMYCGPGVDPLDPIACVVTTQPVTIRPSDGRLIFQPAANQYGTTTVSLYLQDDGGTDDGGVDRFPAAPAVHTFDIVVTPVNDPPSFTKGPHQVVPVGTNTAQAVPNWATNISAGPNEPDQTVTFEIVGNTNTALFTVAPAVSSAGTLTYQPTGSAGFATITIRARDNGTPSLTSANQTFDILVGTLNQPPSFDKGPDVVVNEDSGQYTHLNWATNISRGAGDPTTQTVTFIMSNNNTVLFSQQPVIGPFPGSTAGRLQFTPAANRYGVATVTVIARDNGGTAAGGQNESAPETFTITITPVNDPPSFTASNLFVEASTASPTDHTFVNWVSALSAGPFEDDQLLTGSISVVSGSSLFSPGGEPTLVDRALSFTTAVGQSGVATIAVTYTDDGIPNLSVTQNYLIHIGVNSPPSFNVAASHPLLLEDSPGTITLSNMITGISPGNLSGDVGQSVTLSITNNSQPAYFSSGPTIVQNGDGTANIVFTLAADRFGTAVLTVVAQDDGGTVNGGVDTSAPRTVNIVITGVNDPPSFTIPAGILAPRIAGTQNFTNFATSISAGPFETQTVTFSITSNSNSALFTVQPTVNSAGTLSFTAATTGSGSQVATIGIRASDNGGTANGGVNTSAIQTFTITITDPNLPPVVPNRSITTFANTPLTVGPGDTGHRLLDGITDPNGTTTFTLGNITGISTGAQVEILDASLGTYRFRPRINTTTNGSFTYQVCDTGFNGLPPACATGTVTVTVLGPVIVYVDGDALAGGDGSIDRPLQDFPAHLLENHAIFVYSGTYNVIRSGGNSITAVRENTKVIGQGGSGTFDSTFGLDPTLITVGSIPPRPSMAGTRPIINRLGAFDPSTASGGGFTTFFGTNGPGVGSIAFRNLVVNNPRGSMLRISGREITGTIDNVTITGYNGIMYNEGFGSLAVTNSSINVDNYGISESTNGLGTLNITFTSTPITAGRLYLLGAGGATHMTFNSPVNVQRIEVWGLDRSMTFNATATVNYPGTFQAVHIRDRALAVFNAQLSITTTDPSGQALQVSENARLAAPALTNSVNVPGTRAGIVMNQAIVEAAGVRFQNVTVNGIASPATTALDFQNVTGGNLVISNATITGCVYLLNAPTVTLPVGTPICGS
jgi:VCBS repeat-containing protein